MQIQHVYVRLQAYDTEMIVQPWRTDSHPEEPKRSQMPDDALVEWRSIGGLVTAPQSTSTEGQISEQQQRIFFDAFQAAVDQHTGVRTLLAPLLTRSSQWHLLLLVFYGRTYARSLHGLQGMHAMHRLHAYMQLQMDLSLLAESVKFSCTSACRFQLVLISESGNVHAYMTLP